MLFASAVVVYICMKKRQDRQRKELFEKYYLNEDGRYVPFPVKPHVEEKYELDRRRLILDETVELGKGAFGKVYKGMVKGLVHTHKDATSPLADVRQNAYDCKVAVKMCYGTKICKGKRKEAVGELGSEGMVEWGIWGARKWGVGELGSETVGVNRIGRDGVGKRVREVAWYGGKGGGAVTEAKIRKFA